MTPPRADLVGEAAIQVVELAYMRARASGRPQPEIDDLREWICLARGWRFTR